MSSLTVSVANCFLTGEQITRRADSSWTRNRILFKLGSNTRCEIVQNQEGMSRPRDSYRGEYVYTSDIVVQGVTQETRRSAERIANDLCVLLSLSTMSQVHPFSYALGGRSWGHNPKGVSIFSRPAFELSDGASVRRFVEQVWPRYRRLKRTRKLPEIIDYITTAEAPGQPLEVRLLLVFVALESLKATYAHSTGVPYTKGAFRKVSHPPKRKLSSEPRYTFEELVSMMMYDVRMRRGIRHITTLRNEIVHFGISRRPYSSLSHHYDRCQDLIREYLLRLLGFRGRFMRYAEAGRGPRGWPSHGRRCS